MTYPKKLPITYWLKKHRFCLPKIITFDAYNTLYCSTIPVMEQYSQEGKKFGIDVPSTKLAKRFPLIFQSVKTRYPNYGKSQNLNYDEWWSILIRELFKPDIVSDSMVLSILTRFEGRNAYAVYPDVLKFLKFIKKEHPEIILGIISNTDPKVYKLLENLDILKYFENHIYLSYDIELSKPDVKLFDYVFDDITRKEPSLLKDMNSSDFKKIFCWHIGDEYKNDMLGSSSAGWKGVLIDRSNRNHYFNEEQQGIEKRPEHDLSLEKIDQTMNQIWELSEHQNDVIQLDQYNFVLSNFYSFQRFFF